MGLYDSLDQNSDSEDAEQLLNIYFELLNDPKKSRADPWILLKFTLIETSIGLLRGENIISLAKENLIIVNHLL